MTLRILVSGSSGYIASQLIRDLPKAFPKAEITLTDVRFNPQTLGNLKGKFRFVKCDLRDENQVWNLVKGVDWDILFHLAALVEAENSPARAEETWNVNFECTKRLVNLGSFKKIIFASTANVYGNNTDLNLNETTASQPIFPYACAKKACEDYLISSFKPAVILRLATNFGLASGIRNNLVINTMVENAICGKDLTVHGNGDNWRPFIHVKDTSKMLIAAAKNGKVGEIYNVGAFNRQIGKLAEEIGAICGVKVNYEKEKNVPFSYDLDFSKSKELKCQPKITLEQGVKELLKYYGGFR